MTRIRRVLILGGARSVFIDMNDAYRLCPEYDAVFGINDIVQEVPEITHALTMHPDKMPKWLEGRVDNGHSTDLEFWTAADKKVPPDLPFQRIRNTRGGSGLLAIYVARHLGFNKIVLAGIPMTQEGEHYHTSGKWRECRLYRVVWENESTEKDDVRSLSGWTREKFGEPTIDWFNR